MIYKQQEFEFFDENERWAWVPEYEGLYLISNWGKIKSFHKKLNGNFMKLQFNNQMYLSVWISKNGSQFKTNVHSLVAKTFIQNPNKKPHINHINGIKSDNRAKNLEWVTPKENIQHAWNTRLCKQGQFHPSNQISQELANQIILEYKPYRTSTQTLATKFNISNSTVQDFINNKRWVKNDNLNNLYKKNKNNRILKYTTKDIQHIKNLYFNENYTIAKITNLYKATKRTIIKIVNDKYL